MPTTPMDLLAHADTLPFPDRMRWLAEHAGTDYTRLHAELDASTDSARHIGLHLAVVRRDLDAVVAALHDPVLRRRALAAAIRLPVPDAALVAVLDDAPRAVRFALYGVLRRSRRRVLADDLVSVMHERHGVVDVERLLPACSSETATRWLPRTPASAQALHRLARTAPAAVLAHARERCGESDDAEWRRWQRERGGLLIVLAEHDPRSTLVALHREPRLAAGVDGFELLATLMARPDLLLSLGMPAAVRLSATDGTPLPPRVRRALAALDRDQAVDLVGMLPAFGVRELVLAAVRPEFRRAAVDRVHPGERLVADIGLPVLLTLPAPDRSDIATRVLATDRAARTADRLEFTAALPYADARSTLLEAIGSAVVDERSQAWRALLACAARERDPRAVVDALAAGGRVWHDRHRVWSAALEVIAGLPARTLAAIPLDHLREAVDAAAGSWSAEQVARWCARTGPTPIDLLARIITERDGPLDDLRVPEGVEHRLWEAVRADHRAALRLATALGPRLAAVPELDDLVGGLAVAGDEDAVRCWIAAPATRESRVARLVGHDPALGTLDGVWHVVANRRTDLLDVLLDHGVVPPRIGRRWTDRQRSRANALAAAEASDAARLSDRVTAARTITDPALSAHLAHTAPERVAVAALAALARHGAPDEVLPILVRHSGRPAGPAAREAVAGMRRVLASMSDSVAVPLLHRLLLDQRVSIGAAKQAVRVLADTGPSGAVEVLIDLWADPSAHRDLRAVVAAALVGHADDPRVPPLLAQALRGADAVRDALLAAVPAAPPPEHLQPLAEVLADALDLGATKVIRAYGRLWRHAPGGVEPLGSLVTGTAIRSVFLEAASVLVRMASTDRGLEVLRAALDRLVREAGPTTWRDLVRIAVPAGGEDFDDRRATVVRTLARATLAAGKHGPTVKLLRALADRSLGDPTAEVDLALWNEVVAVIDERPLRWAAWDGRGGRRSYAPDRAADVVDHLAGLGGSVPGLLAVGLVGSVGRDTGWPAEWLARLDFWRAHPDPDVREAARAE